MSPFSWGVLKIVGRTILQKIVSQFWRAGDSMLRLSYAAQSVPPVVIGDSAGSAGATQRNPNLLHERSRHVSNGNSPNSHGLQGTAGRQGWDSSDACERSGTGTRRIAQAHQRDEVARPGNGR